MVVEGLGVETSRNSPSLTFSITGDWFGVLFYLIGRRHTERLGGKAGPLASVCWGSQQSLNLFHLHNCKILTLSTSTRQITDLSFYRPVLGLSRFDRYPARCPTYPRSRTL